MSAVHVIVDAREGEGVARYLAQRGAIVERRRLRFGDYALGNGIVVERKTVRDLHLTLAAGRLWRQVDRLRRVARVPVLLIEGDRLDAGPIRGRAIRGACLSVVDLGVLVIRAADPSDSAEWVHVLATRAGRRPRRDRPLSAQVPKTRNRERAAEAMLCAVPGISVVTARSLLDAFGSLAALVAAGQEAWAQVDGMGDSRRRSLAAALYEQASLPSPSRSEGRGPST